MIVSACLLGLNCRYDGGNVKNAELVERLRDACVIPVCPEQLGGLPTPRESCEIMGGDGFDVLKGKAVVLSRSGVDYTENFVKGANEVLKIVRTFEVELAIFKDLSPSCGVRRIYDGSFGGKTKVGVGVTTALLKLNGVDVIAVEEFLNKE
ncbi:protein of unknown function DUF523 [Archaeoglobus profundus DSM 5631]|uniref:Uncharacterized protein n=1 Tax=Archaeoglobus profundus (strain DSM 5631 / JCM 9629 / NBRC 100127 / Av18) TaxID=572546 RepID=D2RDH3_ARCPA|nr:DUF523 domain-containing protein [Archaeoglobus profundus]ADB58167.1 protein of unknown function DUF523 [Archaeoglobus profundus DSM 5631]